MKLTKLSQNNYTITINDVKFSITPNMYSYYKQYNLCAIYKDGSYQSFENCIFHNLEQVKNFIKNNY